MISLDTNVLVHYIMQDDAAQSPKVNHLIESLTPESPGFMFQSSNYIGRSHHAMRCRTNRQRGPWEQYYKPDNPSWKARTSC
jgi:predicted nucleic acid-binding protein